MPAAIAPHDQATTRPPAWRWLVTVVAFIAYLLAGMHFACADVLVGGSGDQVVAFDGDDGNGNGDADTGHCHAAHLQVQQVATETPRPGVSASRRRVPTDAPHASAERPRLEDPPRS